MCICGCMYISPTDNCVFPSPTPLYIRRVPWPSSTQHPAAQRAAREAARGAEKSAQGGAGGPPRRHRRLPALYDAYTSSFRRRQRDVCARDVCEPRSSGRAAGREGSERERAEEQPRCWGNCQRWRNARRAGHTACVCVCRSLLCRRLGGAWAAWAGDWRLQSGAWAAVAS